MTAAALAPAALTLALLALAPRLTRRIAPRAAAGALAWGLVAVATASSASAQDAGAAILVAVMASAMAASAAAMLGWVAWRAPTPALGTRAGPPVLLGAALAGLALVAIPAPPAPADFDRATLPLLLWAVVSGLLAGAGPAQPIDRLLGWMTAAAALALGMAAAHVAALPVVVLGLLGLGAALAFEGRASGRMAERVADLAPPAGLAAALLAPDLGLAWAGLLVAGAGGAFAGPPPRRGTRLLQAGAAAAVGVLGLVALRLGTGVTAWDGMRAADAPLTLAGAMLTLAATLLGCAQALARAGRGRMASAGGLHAVAGTVVALAWAARLRGVLHGGFALPAFTHVLALVGLASVLAGAGLLATRKREWSALPGLGAMHGGLCALALGLDTAEATGAATLHMAAFACAAPAWALAGRAGGGQPARLLRAAALLAMLPAPPSGLFRSLLLVLTEACAARPALGVALATAWTAGAASLLLAGLPRAGAGRFAASVPAPAPAGAWASGVACALLVAVALLGLPRPALVAALLGRLPGAPP